MGSCELEQVPSATKNPPLTTEGMAPAKTPVLGRVQNTVIDQSLRPSHEPVPLRTQLPPRGRLGTGERDRQFFSSDDSALDKRILATHAPDMQELNVGPILSIIEDILRLGDQASAHLDTSAEKVSPCSYHDDDAQQTSNLESDIVKLRAYPINNISCEIVCKCIGGEESHAVTMDLLKSLASYSWDAKLVIAFAGFAIINCGEFWLVEHLHTKNVIATLRDLPDIIGGELRKQFGAVLDLLTAILKVTHCIIEFNEVLPLYINAQSVAMTAATAHIPTAVYWSIRGLLVCTSTLLKLAGDDHEYITLTWVSWEILNLAHKLNVILEQLQAQMKLCREISEWKKSEGAYIELKKLVEFADIDNMKVLRAFFRYRDDQKPLYDGTKRKNERLEVLRLKYVLLLISDLDLPPEELRLLHLINNDPSVRYKCEVLWLPIVDPAITMTSVEDAKFYNLRNNIPWYLAEHASFVDPAVTMTPVKEAKFYKCRNNMPWYSVEHPSFVDVVAVKYIREDLRFTHMPMLVVLDPQGKLSNHDALPMMWSWGAKAFPFTKDREKTLWKESYWNIDLIADAIDPRFPEWINNNRVICLYGGDDINWIRKFIRSAQKAARALNVLLEMLYVGQRNPKKRIHLCHDVILKENLSHIFSTNYHDYVWYFWERLASMLNSKKQMGRTVDDDRITEGILDLLTFDSSEQGWAIFSRGNYDITMANGENLVPILDNHRQWGYEVDHPDKFVPVLDKQLQEKKKFEDAYIAFKRLLESAHIDNMKVLRAFFHYRDDQRPLYNGAKRINERLEVLRLKYVLLLISDLNLPPKELYVLHLINNNPSMRHEYEVLWLPIVHPTMAMTSVKDTKFYNLRNNMPWYSAEYPSFIDPVAIRYIQEDLHFTHMPMLVVLDPQGKLANYDALPMMWIWGAKAFPFTRDWEMRLWDESNWNIDFIADAIDLRIPEWINTNKHICLYGGNDINWIRKFTQSARATAKAVNVQLEMLYIGQRNLNERVRLCHDVIFKENLSHIFSTDNYNYVWYFWKRFAIMWNSKKQMGRTVDDDRITQGILDLLTFDKSENSWAIFSHGNYDITMANGENMVPVLDNYPQWGYEVDHPDKFVPMLDKQLQDKKKFEDAYIAFKRLLESVHIDNMKVLRAFFHYRDDQRPLYDGAKWINEELNVLRLKYVLLLISDLDFPPEELHVLYWINSDPYIRHEYEVLWLPIVHPTMAMTSVENTKFYNLRNNMPWYSAEYPSFIDPVAIRYIQKDLHFTHMPMLVVLDHQGKLANHDALPMMWIWGPKAFPFTRDWEMRLWDESIWNIDFIADAIDPRIPEWISTNKVVCLYGGDDINWVRKFTQSARTAARALNVQLDMLYVGRRNPNERVRLCHEVIARENLSHIFATDYYDYVWYFWVRLASMWNSKKQMGRTVDDDHITQRILDLLTFDSSENGWAIFSRGNYEITMANGKKMVPVLDNYTAWAHEVDYPDMFVLVLDKHLQGFHHEHHCNCLILPGQARYIPETVVCSECGKTMDKYVMYRCCDN